MFAALLLAVGPLTAFGLETGVVHSLRGGAVLSGKPYLNMQEKLESESYMYKGFRDIPCTAEKCDNMNRVIVVTSTNSHHRDMTLNLFHSMKKVGRNKLRVFCEGGDCDMNEEGMTVVKHGRKSNYEFPDDGNMSPVNRIHQHQPELMEFFLWAGYTVLWCDSDIVWINDPIEYIESMGTNYHMAFQDDDPWPLTPDETPYPDVPEDTPGRFRWHPINSGFMMVKPTTLGLDFVRRWKRSVQNMTRLYPDLRYNVEVNTNQPTKNFIAQKALLEVFDKKCKNVCFEEVSECKNPQAPDLQDCLVLKRRKFPTGSVHKTKDKDGNDVEVWDQDVRLWHLNHNRGGGMQRKVEQMQSMDLWHPNDQPAMAPAKD